MIDRCIVCHLNYVDEEKMEGYPPLCGNCMQKAEIKTTQQNPGPLSICELDGYVGGAEKPLQNVWRGVSEQLGIVGKGYQTEHHVMGNYSSGDRMKVWGKQSVFRTLSWRAYFTFVLATCSGPRFWQFPTLSPPPTRAEIQQDWDRSKQQEQINDLQRNQQLENLTRDQQLDSTQQRLDTVKPQSPT